MQNEMLDEMLVNYSEELFYERYRPQRIKDLILPQAIKDKLQRSLDTQNIPNLGLFSGNPGTGKTSTAKAIITEFLNKYGGESKFINASMEKGIDSIRSEVARFAAKKSFESKIKIIVFDEADNQTQDAQKSLRGLIEEFSQSCRFIFTGNYKENVLPAILSRLEMYDFNELSKEEMIQPIFNRLKFILENEKIKFNPKDLIPVINTFYPNIRDMVKTLQQYSSTGEFIMDSKEIDQINSNNVLIGCIIKGEYKGIILEANNINNPGSFYKNMYSKILELSQDQPKFQNPMIIVVLAKYQHMDLSVRDRNLNLAACSVEIMNIVK